jgi:uncharacterized membrane protein
MKWDQKNTWLLPFASAIIAAVSLATPVAIFPRLDGSSVVFWLWALNVDTRDGDIWFNTDELALAGAILETAVLVLAIVILFIIAFSVKTGKSRKSTPVMLVLCVILLLLSPIGYMIGAEIYDEGFWMVHPASFGIIGPIIAAGLVIVTIVLSKMK